MCVKNRAVVIVLLCVVIWPVFASHVGLDGYMLVEEVGVLNGGLHSGSVYNAVLNPILNYSFENYPKQSSAKVGVLAIADSNNNFQYTNALQNISNMSAQREIRISELNYFQYLNKYASMRIGIMDMRDYMNSYDIPKELINSGFGTNRVMNSGANVSTYPYSGLGTILQYSSDNYSLQAAVFQGNPQHIKSVFNDGALFVEQFDLKFDWFYLKIGAWQNYQPNPSYGFSNIGAYLMGQYAWSTDSGQQMSIFSQLGYSNNKRNILPYSFAAGVTHIGLIPGRKQDRAALGMTSVWLRNLKNETIIEITYSVNIIKNLYINPDVQYIINPRGYLANSWAGVLRLTYEFDSHLIERR